MRSMSFLPLSVRRVEICQLLVFYVVNQIVADFSMRRVISFFYNSILRSSLIWGHYDYRLWHCFNRIATSYLLNQSKPLYCYSDWRFFIIHDPLFFYRLLKVRSAIDYLELLVFVAALMF